MNYDGYEALKIRREGRILRLTLNRPAARNAIDARLHDELARIFQDIDDDPDAHVVILTGEGDAFCAGGDLKWMLDMDLETRFRVVRNDRRIQEGMLDLEKPIIARVVGPAIGLGCSLALYCDFVYATPEARLADPHVSVGLVAGDGGAVIWPQLIGYMRAKRYLLTGDPITGSDAAQMGLITEAVPADRIDAVVDAMAARLAGGATRAIRWTKASVNSGLKQIASAVLDRAAGFEAFSMFTRDHRIALEAFAAKHAPEFTGS